MRRIVGFFASLLFGIALAQWALLPALATDGTQGTTGPATKDKATVNQSPCGATGCVFDSMDPPHYVVVSGTTYTLTGHGTATITNISTAADTGTDYAAADLIYNCSNLSTGTAVCTGPWTGTLTSTGTVTATESGTATASVNAYHTITGTITYTSTNTNSTGSYTYTGTTTGSYNWLTGMVVTGTITGTDTSATASGTATKSYSVAGTKSYATFSTATSTAAPRTSTCTMSRTGTETITNYIPWTATGTGTDQVVTGNDPRLTATNTVTGTGSENYVAKWSGAATLKASSVYEDTNGYVGMGRTDPTARLSVASNDDSASSLVQEWSYYGVPAAYNLQLKTSVTAGNVRWTFGDTNNSTGYTDVFAIWKGFVGIGTASPAYSLDVIGGTQLGSTDLYVTTRYGAADRGVGLGYLNSAKVGAIYSNVDSGASGLAFWGYSGAAWGETVRFTGDGKVGILRTNPATTLDVGGTISADGNAIVCSTGMSCAGVVGTGTSTATGTGTQIRLLSSVPPTISVTSTVTGSLYAASPAYLTTGTGTATATSADLFASPKVNVSVGTTSGTVAAGNDSRFGAVMCYAGDNPDVLSARLSEGNGIGIASAGSSPNRTLKISARGGVVKGIGGSTIAGGTSGNSSAWTDALDYSYTPTKTDEAGALTAMAVGSLLGQTSGINCYVRVLVNGGASIGGISGAYVAATNAYVPYAAVAVKQTVNFTTTNPVHVKVQVSSSSASYNCTTISDLGALTVWEQ